MVSSPALPFGHYMLNSRNGESPAIWAKSSNKSGRRPTNKISPAWHRKSEHVRVECMMVASTTCMKPDVLFSVAVWAHK